MRRAVLPLLAFPAAVLAQTPAPQPPMPAAPAAPEKVVCKSFAEVGSLIATHKECKTKREWAAEAGENQRRLGDCINTGNATGSRC